MFSNKVVVLVILEPTRNEAGYVSKYIPLIKKHIDGNLFEVHIIGSCSGSKPLKKEFDNVHSVMFNPKATILGFYLSYILYLLFVFFKVMRIAPKIGAKVLVSLGGHAYSGLVATTSARFLGIKSIIRISEPTRYIVLSRYALGPMFSSAIRILERLAFSLSTVVVANRDMHFYSSNIGKKLVVLSQGVDLSLFNSRIDPVYSSKAFPTLITVSRLDKQKNIKSVIKAVELLKDKYPEILYNIVGSGPDEVDLRDTVTEFAVDEHVCFYGYASPETIPSLLRSCDVFVLPSFIEGLPSAVLEAMACGLPTIIGSTRYGWKEWFIDGENALIVDGSSRSIAKAIDKLISNEELRGKLIVNGVKYAGEYHDSSKTKPQFTEIVQKLLKNP